MQRRALVYSVPLAFCLVLAPLSVTAAPPKIVKDADYLLREVDLLGQPELADAREGCALNRVANGFMAIRKDALVHGDPPPPDIYCLRVLSVSRAKGRMADLYINLALQEQGYDSLMFAQQAQLLKNNEAGRTFQAVLMAANAGQTSYTSITGKARDLTCALAIDAGETWASANPTAASPMEITGTDAAAVARQCYAGGPITTITVNGNPLPASKAGLIAGIWLARH